MPSLLAFRNHGRPSILDGTGWLPDPLRLAGSTDMSDMPVKSAEELPAFLADGEREVATDESEPAAIAAE